MISSMRALLVAALIAAGCGNDVDPRVIPGGGVGDGEIDGEVNVHVIDSQTNEPIVGATVAIGETEKKTDAKGLVVFADVEGAQTIAVLADGYRSGVWVKVNGANVTMPIEPLTGAPEMATLSGTIAGWANVTVPQAHVKAAFILYSQTDRLGDKANNISTPNNGNLCFGPTECAWTVVTRTGSVTLTAVIVDRDTKGTLDDADDTNSIIGYAFKQTIAVAGGVNQSGLSLDLVEAGNLETVTIDEGTPPAGLPEVTSFPGIEIGDDEVVQLPLVFPGESTSYLVPRRTVYGADATYRLTAIAQTTSGGAAAQSIILRQGLADPALAAGEWLVPPVNVVATRTTASFSPVMGAKAHSITWRDEMGDDLLEITVFDSKTKAVEVPNLVALPPSGTLTARVNAIGADFDVNDFSLEEDSSKLWGIASQPIDIP
jgi:hypothetical protein